MVPHRVCAKCGSYNKKEIIQVEDWLLYEQLIRLGFHSMTEPENRIYGRPPEAPGLRGAFFIFLQFKHLLSRDPILRVHLQYGHRDSILFHVYIIFCHFRDGTVQGCTSRSESWAVRDHKLCPAREPRKALCFPYAL
jgi:hypothetical protein